MPTAAHETPIAIFRDNPGLAAQVLTDVFQLKLPSWQEARNDATDLTELVPTEYRADLVSVLTDKAGEPVLAVVVEMQLPAAAGGVRPGRGAGGDRP